MAKSPRRRGHARHSWLAALSAVALAGALLPAATPAVATAARVTRGGWHLAPSGTDASCPAATTAGAGSPTVGAPADVRAIGGEASATVVWCPPVTGAAHVVSYTVTSSGGQTVTAAVPNDWAIVDGLSDGTGYTFTVTASTSAGASGPAATSNSVTPAPIAPPRDVLRGQPQQVSYDQYSLMISTTSTWTRRPGIPTTTPARRSTTRATGRTRARARVTRAATTTRPSPGRRRRAPA